MMSLNQIADLSRKQARLAAKLHKKPYTLWEEDLKHMPPFPFPNIGSYRPKGWELVEEYFVDKTGFGADDEPALTIQGFLKVLKPGMGYAIIEEGEFQCYVGEFKKEASLTPGKDTREANGD